MVSVSRTISLFISIWLLSGYLPGRAQDTPVTVKRDTVITAGESFAVIVRIVDNSQSVYKITREALDSLNSRDDVPGSVSSKLAEKKGEEIKGRKFFIATLQKLLGESQELKYEAAIFQYTDQTKYKITRESLEHLTKLGKLDPQMVVKLNAMEKKSFTGEHAFRQALQKVFGSHLTREEESKIFTFTRKIQKIEGKTNKVLIIPAAMEQTVPAEPGYILRLGDQLLLDNSVFVDFQVINNIPQKPENHKKSPVPGLRTQEEKAEAKFSSVSPNTRIHSAVSPETREYYAGFFQPGRQSEGFFRLSPGAEEYLPVQSLPETQMALEIIADSDSSGRIGFGVENGTLVVEKVEQTIPVRTRGNEIGIGTEAMLEAGDKRSILFLPRADTAMVDGRVETRKSDLQEKQDYGNYFELHRSTGLQALPLDSQAADTLSTTFKYVKKDVWSVFKPWYLTPAGLLLLGGGAAAVTTTTMIIVTNGKKEQRPQLPEPPSLP